MAGASGRSWTSVSPSLRPVVRSLGQVSAAIALGSAFFHASHTSLGQRTDGDIISVIALIMHQAALSGLPEDLKTPQLMDLGAGRRSRTGVQIAQVTQPRSNKQGRHLAVYLILTTVPPPRT